MKTKVIDIIEDIEIEAEDENNDVFKESWGGDVLNDNEDEHEGVLFNNNDAEEGNIHALDNCHVHDSGRIENEVLVENNRRIMMNGN